MILRVSNDAVKWIESQRCSLMTVCMKCTVKNEGDSNAECGVRPVIVIVAVVLGFIWTLVHSVVQFRGAHDLPIQSTMNCNAIINIGIAWKSLEARSMSLVYRDEVHMITAVIVMVLINS